MGIYATTSSLEILMVGTQFDTATTALCSKLITHAENEINKYLSKRYDIGSFYTSSASVPPMITTLAETLTEGYMYQRMSRGGKESMGRGKALIEPVIDNLKLIADYKADLLDANGDSINEASDSAYQVLSTTKDYVPTFNEDNELAWKIDSNKLSDIQSERS